MNFSNYTAAGEMVIESATPSSPFLPSNPSILAADCPLIVPMQLKISLMRLRAIVVLIVSRSTGITLSFKTDPLESVLVSSTFDSLPSVRRHLQAEIENRLRDLFQKEIPAMLHSLSTEWLKANGFSGTSSFSEASESVTSPYRALSPTTSTNSAKYSMPLPPRVNTPKSSTSKSPSIADNADKLPVALSLPGAIPPLHHNFSVVFEASAPLPLQQPKYRCHSVGVPNDQHYFRNVRNIIVRAPTEMALPDPVLLDASAFFKKKPLHVAKMFRSLFRIPELEREDLFESQSQCQMGLKTVKQILVDEDSGSNSVLSSPQQSIAGLGNCSVRSRSRSMLFDHQMINNNRALSTLSGNRFTRPFNIRHSHSQNDRCSEIDPDLVQFEPDEFRSDFRSSSEQPVESSVRRVPSIVSLNGSSRNLSVKFGIMRKLQSTLSPNTFEETNVLYRSMSKSTK